MHFRKKLSLIKGQIIRINYANDKIDKLLDYCEFEGLVKKETAKYSRKDILNLLKWYRQKIRYHHEKALKHLEDIESGITDLAEKETASLIKNRNI